jgi:hypothetical protein
LGARSAPGGWQAASESMSMRAARYLYMILFRKMIVAETKHVKI